MVDAQTIIDLLTPLSITIGVIYYVMVLRNQNKTRQIQLLMQLSDRRNEETSRKGLELLEMEWTDYDDFERKYGSDNNPDNFAMRVTFWNRFNTQGMLLRRGLVDADILFASGGNGPMFHWNKYGPIIKELRRRYNMPVYCTGFEYLAEENRKFIEQRGFSTEVPDTYYRYVPEE